MKIEKTYTTFEQSKWLKKKGFDEECTRFYVESNSKLFGIDEHNRYYPIVNKPKQLWIVGNTVTLNEKNVLLAPEQWQVCEWLRVNHGIWIQVTINTINFGNKNNINEKFKAEVIHQNRNVRFKSLMSTTVSIDGVLAPYDTPQEATSAAFDYILTNNLI
jgi:16S rRNA C967 or C1407 C5-methylase (RsmB/RsmF family)